MVESRACLDHWDTQYLDQLRLLVVDHAPGTRIVGDFEANLHQLAEATPPFRATDENGSDLLPFVATEGGIAWQSHMGTRDKLPPSLQHRLDFYFTRPADADSARQRGRPLIGFSRATTKRHRALKAFLNKRLYRHERVLEMTEQATSVVTELFERFMDDVHAMPKSHADRALQGQDKEGDAGRARAVADYVAGMTDRYALSAYARLVGETPDLEMRAQLEREEDG